MSRRYLLLALALCLTACDSREAAQAPRPETGAAVVLKGTSTAPAASQGSGGLRLLLTPVAPTVQDDLAVLVQNAADATSIQWLRNGIEIPGAVGEVLPRNSALKGETVTARVQAGSAEASVSVVIGNSPPQVIALPFRDPIVQGGKPLELVPEGIDPDGDPLSYSYRWQINGAEVSFAEGAALPGELVHKGDRIQVVVTPSDGDLQGPPYRGGGIVVPNAPPKFISTPPLSFRSAVYSYQPQVSDPDGDPVTFSLEQGPAGMTIDPASGRVTWKIGGEQTGTVTVRIVAADPEGMKAVQEFQLNVTITPEGG